jgi:hypothetical protein
LYLHQFGRTQLRKFGGGWYIGIGVVRYNAQGILKERTSTSPYFVDVPVMLSDSEYYYNIGWDNLYERWAFGGFFTFGTERYRSFSLFNIGLRF